MRAVLVPGAALDYLVAGPVGEAARPRARTAARTRSATATGLDAGCAAGRLSPAIREHRRPSVAAVVDDRQVPLGVAAQPATWRVGQPVAHPLPVQRDPVAGRDAADHADPVDGLHRGLGLPAAPSRSSVAVPGQRRATRRRPGRPAPRAPAPTGSGSGPARSSACGGLAAVGEQAGVGVDAEDGEAVVRHAPGQHALGEAARTGRRSGSGTGPPWSRPTARVPTRSSRGLPTQYASTTRRSSGSSIPVAPAISSR